MNKKTFIIAMILLIADQLSKSIVEIYLNLSESIKVIIISFI